jgi:uncharacterized delta-60 repeat protein
MKKAVIFGLLAGAVLGMTGTVCSQVNQDWVAIFNGARTWNDVYPKVAVDSAGNVYVAGTSYYGVTYGEDITSVKYNPTGQQLWAVHWDGVMGGQDDRFSALVLDSAGNVYVTGATDVVGPGQNDDFVTIKYNPDGQLQWTATYNGPSNNSDCPRAIAIDPSGNIIVTGESYSPYYLHSNTDYCTIKYNSNGQQLLVARYDGIGHDNDKPVDLAVDHEGNIYVTGMSDQDTSYSGENWAWVTIKYDAQGQQQWVASHGSNTAYIQPFAIAVDDSGEACVTGDWYTPQTGWDYLTIKYDTQGHELWTANYNGWFDEAQDLALDSAGNVYVVGRSGLSAHYLTTIKYNPEGQQQWVVNYYAFDTSLDTRAHVKIDRDNNVYVVGDYTLYGVESNWVLIKYSDFGVQQWAEIFDSSPLENEDWAPDLALGHNGDVVVTGTSAYEGVFNQNFATVKYSQANVLHVTLTPINPPIQIPASGGSFQFNATLSNTSTIARQFSLWFMARLPNQSWYGPVLGPLMLTLSPSAAITRMRTQNVPASAPSGNYIYEARIGVYPDTIYAYSNFGFMKLNNFRQTGMTDSSDWVCTGEDFPSVESTPFKRVAGEDLVAVSPNPFNSSTVISFQLSDFNHFNLKVYNTAGRLEKTLVDGWRSAGEQKIIFDGSGLPSGIYLLSLQAGKEARTIKLIHVK